MKVVIDTNIFIRDFKFTNAKTIIFFESCEVLGYNIYVPEIVAEEVVNNYKKELEAASNNIDKQLIRLKKLASGDTKVKIDLDIDGEVANYRQFFTAKIKHYSVDLLDYPNISHRELVNKAIKRTRPFAENGRGYQDSLIWENVKSLVDKSSAPGIAPGLILLTANTSDFGECGNLHTDLCSELKSIGVDENMIRVVSSIEIFMDRYINPHLEELKSILVRLREAHSFSIDFNADMVKGIKDFVRSHEFSNSALHLFPYCDHFHIKELQTDDISFTYTSVQRLPDDRIVIKVFAKCLLKIDFFVYHSDYYGLPDHLLDVAMREWNDSYIMNSTGRSISLNIFIITTKEMNSIDLIDITLPSAI